MRKTPRARQRSFLVEGFLWTPSSMSLRASGNCPHARAETSAGLSTGPAAAQGAQASAHCPLPYPTLTRRPAGPPSMLLGASPHHRPHACRTLGHPIYHCHGSQCPPLSPHVGLLPPSKDPLHSSWLHTRLFSPPDPRPGCLHISQASSSGEPPHSSRETAPADWGSAHTDARTRVPEPWASASV